jgi:hypothetical protein
MSHVFLKNTATKWQSNSIDLQSAYIVLSAQTMDQIKNWQVFIDDGGEAEWVCLLDSPVIVDLLRNGGEPKTEASFELPKEFFNPPVEEQISSEELNVVVENDPEAVVEPVAAPAPVEPTKEKEYANRRQHPRFDIRLRVIIKSGKKTFMTYTRDVSLGGLSLVADVPDYIFNSEAEIYITAPDNKNNLKLICSPVASKLGKSRLMFTQIEEGKQKVLATWLHHVVQPSATKVVRSS